MLSACVCQTRQPFGMVSDRANVCLEHALLRWGRTDPFAEPPEVGGVPARLAGITDIVPQEKRFAPKLGSLEITDNIFTCPA